MIAFDLTIRKGDFTLAAKARATGPALAICGPSGAGKTSLLDALAGLDPAARGRIEVDGAVLQDDSAGVNLPAHRRRIGYVFQDARLFPHLGVAGNLRYGARHAPSGEAPALEFVADLLGLRALLARRTGDLSGGERQRVAIGRALMTAPRLLLLDEALAAQDAGRRGDILAHVATLRDALRRPIVFVSHRAEDVQAVATDLATIADGKLDGAVSVQPSA